MFYLFTSGADWAISVDMGARKGLEEKAVYVRRKPVVEMGLGRYLSSRLKEALPAILKISLAVALLHGLVVAVGAKKDISAEVFTRDPVQVLGGAFYTGFLSNLGILLWCAAAALCFFGFVLLRKGPFSRFFLAAGLLGALLMLDDLFLLHEVFFPHYMHLPEKAVYAGYLVAVVFFVLRFWRLILFETGFPLLGFAFFSFALSMLADIREGYSEWDYLLEDGFKFLGIAGWLGYFSKTAYERIKRELVRGGEFSDLA